MKGGTVGLNGSVSDALFHFNFFSYFYFYYHYYYHTSYEPIGPPHLFVIYDVHHCFVHVSPSPWKKPVFCIRNMIFKALRDTSSDTGSWDEVVLRHDSCIPAQPCYSLENGSVTSEAFAVCSVMMRWVGGRWVFHCDLISPTLLGEVMLRPTETWNSTASCWLRKRHEKEECVWGVMIWPLYT